MNEKKVTHCPKCQKPAINSGQFIGSAQFNIKCPWCQAVIRITVQPKIVAEVVIGTDAQHMQDTINPYGHSQTHDMLFDPETASLKDLDESLPQIPKDGMRISGYLYPDKR